MNLENPRGHVVFDCDGTLISSEQQIFKGLVVLLSEFLEREVDLDEVKGKYVPDLTQLCKNFELDLSMDNSLGQRMLKRWQDISDSLDLKYELFDGVKEVLEELGKANFLLYVWTGRDRKTTLEILKDQEVAGNFLDFRCVDDTTPKPHPQGLFEMLGSDVDKSKVMMIGDSFADILGAKNFGCHSLGVTWSKYANENSMKQEGADKIVATPKECLEYILEVIK